MRHLKSVDRLSRRKMERPVFEAEEMGSFPLCQRFGGWNKANKRLGR